MKRALSPITFFKRNEWKDIIAKMLKGELHYEQFNKNQNDKKEYGVDYTL